MASTETPAPVIRIVKKKHVHGGHHGGSWKVAYADFVTAMMAFFLVMWIISMDQNVRVEIQEYFNDPFSASNSKAGIAKNTSGGRNPLASGLAGAMDSRVWAGLAMDSQHEKFTQTREKLQQEISKRPDLSRLKGNIHIRVGDNGLVIELTEQGDSLFFESGSSRVPEDARTALGVIAQEVGRLPNPVAIEGHTDSVPFARSGGYSNWELSTDRANAARRIMEEQGLRPRQVTEVRGCADSHLRDPQHPTDASNRRVSILVNYLKPPDEDRPEGSGGGLRPKEHPFDVDLAPLGES